MASVDDTLSQRNQTHGDFADNARFMQTLKEICRSERGWNKLDYVKREAVEAIIVKIGRILTGDPNHKDNWHDIAGYALLAEEKSD